MADHNLHPITHVNVEQQNEQEAPLLVLEDDQGRRFELVIGLCEYMAIQLALHKTELMRPFTHDLLISLADHLDAHIDRVVIDDLSNGTYYAQLVLHTEDDQISLDCRPSDGIAIALRLHVPILASETVILGEEHKG